MNTKKKGLELLEVEAEKARQYIKSDVPSKEELTKVLASRELRDTGYQIVQIIKGVIEHPNFQEEDLLLELKSHLVDPNQMNGVVELSEGLVNVIEGASRSIGKDIDCLCGSDIERAISLCLILHIPFVCFIYTTFFNLCKNHNQN